MYVATSTPSLHNVSEIQYPNHPMFKHTYLAQGTPWSWRRFPSSEALPLHFGWADLDDHPKCGWLGCV